jgi:hypothetical protein
MNFTVKELAIWCLGFVLTTVILGMSYLSAQTAVGTPPAAQPTAVSSNFNAAGYEATPMPIHHHKHKNLMTDNKIPNEGVPPGKPIDGENPQLTIVPAATPNSH